MRRLQTFFPTLNQMICLQLQPWIDPRKNLTDRIEQALFTPRPIGPGVFGDIEPPRTSVPYGPDRNVPLHLLKSRKDSRQW